MFYYYTAIEDGQQRLSSVTHGTNPTADPRYNIHCSYRKIMATITVTAPVKTSPSVADTTPHHRYCHQYVETSEIHSYTEIIDVSKCIFYI